MSVGGGGISPEAIAFPLRTPAQYLPDVLRAIFEDERPLSRLLLLLPLLLLPLALLKLVPEKSGSIGLGKGPADNGEGIGRLGLHAACSFVRFGGVLGLCCGAGLRERRIFLLFWLSSEILMAG